MIRLKLLQRFDGCCGGQSPVILNLLDRVGRKKIDFYPQVFKIGIWGGDFFLNRFL